ncbi:MAG: alpha amylase C-terminal domain-containing protein [Gemmatimonadetes bacterium]|nr:alpha amylase C-terminal domain-containing protein [Gemmatimonadota bacterium]
MALAHQGGDKVYAFTRTRDANTVLVMVNFGDAAVHVTYSAMPVPGDYLDWYAKEKVTVGAAGTLDVPAHGWRVLVKK